MSEARSEQDAQACEKLAALLGDPLPVDWQDPAAVARRQQALARAARRAGRIALDAARLAAAFGSEDVPPVLTATRKFGVAMSELFRARQRYTHETQRGDGSEVIWDALVDAAGETAATVVDGILDRLLRDLTYYG